MLQLEMKEWYQVKEGQTVEEIARAFCVSARRLAAENRLREEPKKGRLLRIPDTRGNVYTAKEGDSQKLLCGSEENFMKKNGEFFYLGMRVIL